MYQTTSAETFTTHFHTKFHIPGCSVSLVFAMQQKYENRFFAAAMLFNVLFKVGVGKKRIFLRNLNTQNFMIPHSSRFHHKILYSWFRASRLCINKIQQDATVYRYIFTASLLCMFRTSIAPIIRSTKNCNCSLWYRSYYVTV